MKNYSLKNVLIGLSLCVAAGVRSEEAAEFSRTAKSELYVLGSYYGGDTTSGLGATMEVDSFIAGGLGMAFNVSEHFNFGVDFTYGNPDIRATYGYREVTFSANAFGIGFNVDYNILKGRLTPFITAGAGVIFWSGDVKDVDFSEMDLSFGVGAGVRWDISDHFLLKAVYRPTWTSFQDTDDLMMWQSFTVLFAYKF